MQWAVPALRVKNGRRTFFLKKSQICSYNFFRYFFGEPHLHSRSDRSGRGESYCWFRFLMRYAATKEAEIDVYRAPLRGGPPINSVPFHKELGSPCSPLGEKVVTKIHS